MSTLLEYPGVPPGTATASVTTERATLENAAVRCGWTLDAGRVTGLAVENLHSGQVVSFDTGYLPRVVLDDGRVIDLASIQPASPVHLDANAIVALFRDDASGLGLRWSAVLGDDANAVVSTLELTAGADTQIREVIFVDAALTGARQVGEVDGSVVVCGDIFMAVEHPLAKNIVRDSGDARCSLPQVGEFKAGESRARTFAIGVVPPGQLRRGFLYYLENRRIHPYRQFLHYNNWYDVVLARPTERITEPECLETVEYFGRELVEKRGVEMDAVVWDDGWDDFNTLWGFHKGFPEGFRNLDAAARRYGISQGVWMSPNGGYARAKDARLAHGRPLGYETNERGFAMAGANYANAFKDVCLKMMRENGVVFFKFDGMNEGGGLPTGATAEFGDDIDAILDLSRALHREDPEVYVSATAGTWASPFWLLYADSVWRQGGDTGHHGDGNTRQQWLNYRDKFCHERVVKMGPLYPLNSLMLHGIVIGDRPGRAPAGMAFDEKSVADEIWSFFGSGTCLQELYVSPNVMSDSMLDELARAAKWSRANADMLIDTHWVGGNPGEGEVYGWASWQPGKGILVLRNPSEDEQGFSVTTEAALELPENAAGPMELRAIYPRDRELPTGAIEPSREIRLDLQPFEMVVMELCRMDPDCGAQ